MQQPEKFICIKYSQVDFLIPNGDVASAVGLNDFDPSLMKGALTGIYDFDEIASLFNESPAQTNLRTMIVLNEKDAEQLSVVTTQECHVCTISLNDFSLFSNNYFENFRKIGLLACIFEDKRIRYLMNVKQTINYMNDLARKR